MSKVEVEEEVVERVLCFLRWAETSRETSIPDLARKDAKQMMTQLVFALKPDSEFIVWANDDDAGPNENGDYVAVIRPATP